MGGMKGPRMEAGDMMRQRIRATDQQREQLGACTGATSHARKQAHEMARIANGSGFSAEEARRQHEQLHGSFQSMQQEHERLMQGLSEEQRTQMKDRLRKLGQARERMQSTLQAMEQELKQATPDRKRLARQAGDAEKALKEWEGQHRKMASDMSVKL